MATQGRHNVHGKAGVRFKSPYTTAKHKSQLRNLVSTLIVDEKVTVTYKMVSDLIKLADRLVTYAKVGDLHSRRLASSVVRDYIADEKKGVLALEKLFSELGPRYKERQGGYTQALRLANRRGDNAPVYLISFVK